MKEGVSHLGEPELDIKEKEKTKEGRGGDLRL